MPNRPKHQKVGSALKQRWGIVGSILAVALFAWYMQTWGNQRNTDKDIYNENLIKLTCYRCHADPEKVKTCSLCQGLGFVWIDKTREDYPPEIKLLIDEAVQKQEK